MESTEKEPKQRYRKLTSREARKLLEYQITARFVEEVHICEKEGRVESRERLERDLLLVGNSVSDMRQARFTVSASTIALLKRKYNGDIQYVLMGVRDREHSGVIMGGRKINIYKPYDFPYRKDSLLERLVNGETLEEIRSGKPQDGPEGAE